MKTLFLKNGMPIATAVLAIIGAFATTSMQNASSAFAPKTGYTLSVIGICDIPVLCDDAASTTLCRISYPAGKQAFGRVANGDCTEILYRPPQ